MVEGIRTIKCYGWELHFLEKIRLVRKKQEKILNWVLFYGSLGFSVFQNIGLVCLAFIIVPMWMQGVVLDEAMIFSLAAMVSYLFLAVNSMTFYAEV